PARPRSVASLAPPRCGWYLPPAAPGLGRAHSPHRHLLTLGGAAGAFTMGRRAVGLPAALAAWQLLPAPEQPAADRPARLRLMDRVQQLVEQTQRLPVVLVGLVSSRPRVPV